MSTSPSAQYDVAIVGFGPTGAMLANLLAMHGLSVLVLEREAQIYDLPRAVHFDDEIMRGLQSIGVSDAMSAKVYVNKGMRFVDYDGNLLLDWPREQTLTDNGWHASYRFHQPELEAELRAALDRYDTATIKLECLVNRIVDKGSHVAISYHNTALGVDETATAQFVVGCDGARSRVREIMQTGMQELGFEQQWLVVDVVLKREMPELGDYTLQFCDASQPATYCRNPGLRRRWEFALLDEEVNDDIRQPENIWQRLERWIGPEDAELERSAIYTFKSCVADKWRMGRLLLAGDAAHLTPPFMGQGMCAGIRDTINLAWKLELVCTQSCDEALLDTYESERKVNVAHYIDTAAKLGELINRIGSGPLPESSKPMKSIRSELGPGLGSDDNPLRGTLFPQPALSDGRRLDDVVGYRPVRVVRAAADGKSTGTDIWQDILTLSAEGEPALRAALDERGLSEVLVRPDRYVLSCERSATPNSDSLSAQNAGGGHAG